MKITFDSQEEKDAFLANKKAVLEKLQETITTAEAAEITSTPEGGKGDEDGA